MSCCGKKRVSDRPAASPIGAPVGAGPRAFGIPAGTRAGGVDFEYLGGSVLTVIGQGTGLQYRFVGHGSRASVDPRDRASLAAVPHLREVTSRRS
jgi:hypothetical protein